MQFEELDNKIREAADNHHPAYDENAWSGMEKLLDKHMPDEKENRKRMIFFLLLFLVLGGAGFWLFSNKPGMENNKQVKAKTEIQQRTGDVSSSVSAHLDDHTQDDDKVNNEEVSVMNIPVDGKLNSNTEASEPITFDLSQSNKNFRQKNILTKNNIDNKETRSQQELKQPYNSPEPANKNIINDNQGSSQLLAPTANTTSSLFVPDQKNNEKDIVAEKNQDPVKTDAKPGVNESTNKDKESLAKKSAEKKTKIKNKKGNNFFFTLSAGPDLSFSGNDKLGKTKLLAGAGLGYTIKDRFTIRSGFYSGRKVYTASPGSYHPPEIFWNYYPYMEKVEADCKVYEIPLSLSYHFGSSTKQNWFVSAGLSSFLMKKETYNYFYKYTAGGPTVQKEWTIQDENKHYFSILTLSGGYQKNIGKSFTIMAEPYIKLPLSGVGYGKVKLNSGGLLITVGFKPFTGSGNQQKVKH
jgi:hypothetical protein